MSSEYLTGEEPLNDEYEEEIRRAIAILSTRVIEELNRINHSLPDAEHIQEELTFITTYAKLSQFELLANTVIEAVKNQRMPYEPLYLIDTAHFETLENDFRDFSLSEFYPQNEKDCKEAINNGMRLGADTLLQMLVPEEVNPERQDTYFTPWRKDILSRIGRTPAAQQPDGGFEIFLPTRLPGVYVVHVYGPEERCIPVEEIRLIPGYGS